MTPPADRLARLRALTQADRLSHNFTSDGCVQDADLAEAWRDDGPTLFAALDAAEALAEAVEQGEGWLKIESYVKTFRAAMAGR